MTEKFLAEIRVFLEGLQKHGHGCRDCEKETKRLLEKIDTHRVQTVTLE